MKCVIVIKDDEKCYHCGNPINEGEELASDADIEDPRVRYMHTRCPDIPGINTETCSKCGAINREHSINCHRCRKTFTTTCDNCGETIDRLMSGLAQSLCMHGQGHGSQTHDKECKTA